MLDKSMFAYERALRWQDYDIVIAMHRNEHNKLTPEQREQLKQFRVTAYEQVYNQLDTNSMTAIQVVEVAYYNEASMTIKKLTLNNKWRFDTPTGRWYLENPLPDFK